MAIIEDATVYAEDSEEMKSVKNAAREDVKVLSLIRKDYGGFARGPSATEYMIEAEIETDNLHFFIVVSALDEFPDAPIFAVADKSLIETRDKNDWDLFEQEWYGAIEQFDDFGSMKAESKFVGICAAEAKIVEAWIIDESAVNPYEFRDYLN